MFSQIVLRILACLATVQISTAAMAQRPDLVIANFDGETYGDWEITGNAFGPGPARGTLPGQMAVEGYHGAGLVNTFFNGDDSTGTLTSPPFRIERKSINFLIGGGGHAPKTAIHLIVEGKIVRTATGPNTKPGGSERLDWDGWDVAQLEGQTAKIQIVDEAKGSWGHLNIDEITQSDRPRYSVVTQRDIAIPEGYLQMGVCTGAPMRRLKVFVDHQLVREFDIELAGMDRQFDVWADLTAWQGKTVTLECRLPAASKALEEIESVGTPSPAPDNQRPFIHFTSQRGWLNDPNGMVYLNGQWHLFYQHNPYGWNWGNMHWGHATSKDLMHWEHQPEAIFPKAWGDWAFSGSAIVDEHNTSGFQTGKTPVLVGAYTSTGRGECIVFSNDEGRTWTEFDGNPVLRHAGRDPRLLWHAPSKHWIMAVYDETPGLPQNIAFYKSPDLKKWTYTSRMEGFFECPDLFPLKVPGEKAEKWILYGADGKYLIGDFDGEVYLPDEGLNGKHKLTLWHGNFYAAQTFSNAPGGRRIQIGWAKGIDFPGAPFNQQMTIPVELALRKTAGKLQMTAMPVREFMKAEEPIIDDESETRSKCARIQCNIRFGPEEQADLLVAGIPVSVSTKAGGQTVVIGPHRISLASDSDRFSLDTVADKNSVEFFVNGGVAAVVLPKPAPAAKVSLTEGTVMGSTVLLQGPASSKKTEASFHIEVTEALIE